MTADELYTIEDEAYRAMASAVCDFDGTGYDGIEAAYQTMLKYVAACPDNAERTAALSQLLLVRMRAKGYIDIDVLPGIEAARVYPGDYLTIIRDGLRDVRMLAVASLYG